MSVEIKITGLTAEETFNELKTLASLMGAGNTAPVKTAPAKETKVEPQVNVHNPDNPELEPTEVKEEETAPVVEEKPKRASRAKANKAEEPKAEEPKAEEPKAEEPKAEEPKAEEPSESKYPEPFQECQTDEEVRNKVRVMMQEKSAEPDKYDKVRAIFMKIGQKYGAKTMPSLSVEGLVEFYQQIKDL